ncbi:MAG TPA: hypothetical protein VGE10_02020 [Zeimonas sp.]
MKGIHKFGIAAAVALVTVGVQAQTVETDYPFVGGTALAAERTIDSRDLQPAEPLLVQSNAEGPKFVVSERAQTSSSDAVRSRATVRFLQAPDVEYPAS